MSTVVHVCSSSSPSPGYIGGSVLTKLLSHPLSETFRVTVLVRAAEKATQFRKMGIQAVVGSYANLELLKELSSNADLVVACVSEDIFFPGSEAHVYRFQGGRR